MFRSASARESALAMHRLDVRQEDWRRTAGSWFDGTPDSIDNRIAKCDGVLAFARDTAARLGSTEAGRHAVSSIPGLEQIRRELTAARDSLLNGFSDRQDASRPAGRRTASRPAAAESLTPSLDRAIELGSRDFLAAQNTDDHDELLHRARRYAAEQTSTLSVPAARQIAAAFVGRVEELIARRPRKRTAQTQQVTAYEDFDDSLMY